MHIPDGYISPQTAGGLWAMMVPAWYYAGTRVRRGLRDRRAPLIAVGAAFTFVIMMFNVPVPGGTTGHVAGGTLVALVVGPWAAVISVTVALVIQALFFGDGGIIALGANCFNMALILPLTGYLVYSLVARGAAADSPRRWLGGAAGAYAGVNAAALLTAVEIGIQPGLFHTAGGAALYSPYGLDQAVPAMMLAHLSVIGPLEAVVTALAVIWIERTDPGLLYLPAAGEEGGGQGPGKGYRLRPLFVTLLLMAIFVPLGLLAGGSAWGEWSTEEIGQELGFIPAGMERFAGWWSGILPDYALPGGGEGFWASTPGYILSAALGLGLAVSASLLIARLLARRSRRGGQTGGKLP